MAFCSHFRPTKSSHFDFSDACKHKLRVSWNLSNSCSNHCGSCGSNGRLLFANFSWRSPPGMLIDRSVFCRTWCCVAVRIAHSSKQKLLRVVLKHLSPQIWKLWTLLLIWWRAAKVYEMLVVLREMYAFGTSDVCNVLIDVDRVVGTMRSQIMQSLNAAHLDSWTCWGWGQALHCTYLRWFESYHAMFYPYIKCTSISAGKLHELMHLRSSWHECTLLQSSSPVCDGRVYPSTSREAPQRVVAVLCTVFNNAEGGKHALTCQAANEKFSLEITHTSSKWPRRSVTMYFG